MVYSHWLSLGPGQGLALGPVLCRTFHITPGPGQGPELENLVYMP